MPDQVTEQKRAVARQIVFMRYDTENPAFDVSATVDEYVERIALAEFFNGAAAQWVHANSAFEWQPIHHSVLIGVQTVRDLGKIVFTHLVEKPNAGPIAAGNPT